MTKKQKEDMVKEMEQFMNEGVPEEAKDKEYKWENEPPIHTYAIEPKQRVNENEKKLEVGNYKDANPVRSEDAVIKTAGKSVEKEDKEEEKKTKETSDR